MTKQPVDSAAQGAVTSDKKRPKKSDRSHEENQERAYIAASRRADRSIEARLQSARAASEVHRKRTGKRFKISEDIVMREEMYEEEDDGLPRRLRLSGQLTTGNPLLNHRLEAYVAGTLAMSNHVQRHHQDIHERFARDLPGAALQLQNLQNTRQSLHAAPFSFDFQPATAPVYFQSHGDAASATGTHPSGVYPEHRRATIASLPTYQQPGMIPDAQFPAPRHTSLDSSTSPPSLLMPGSPAGLTTSDTAFSSPTETCRDSTPFSPGVPADPSGMHDLQTTPFYSPFTSELPMNLRNLGNSFDVGTTTGSFQGDGGEPTGTPIYSGSQDSLYCGPLEHLNTPLVGDLDLNAPLPQGYFDFNMQSSEQSQLHLSLDALGELPVQYDQASAPEDEQWMNWLVKDYDPASATAESGDGNHAQNKV